MIRENREKIQYSAAITSLITNTILIFLIAYKSPKKMGSYRFLLIYVSIFEIIYAFVDILASPITHTYGPTFLVIVRYKNSLLNRKMALIFNSLYCAFFGSSMGLFVIIFVYRYLASTGNQILETFKSWRIIYWFAFPIVYGIIYGLIAYFPFSPNDGTDEFIRLRLLEKFNLKLENIVYTGPLYFSKGTNDTLNVNYFAVSLTVLQWIMTFSSLFMVGSFGLKCYFSVDKFMNDKCKSSKRSTGLQKQLFLALVVQTMIPVFLMHIPVLVLYTCSLLNVEMDTSFVCVTIALFPAIDPFPTMFIIRSYRKAIFRKYSNPSQSRSSSRNPPKSV